MKKKPARKPQKKVTRRAPSRTMTSMSSSSKKQAMLFEQHTNLKNLLFLFAVVVVAFFVLVSAS